MKKSVNDEKFEAGKAQMYQYLDSQYLAWHMVTVESIINKLHAYVPNFRTNPAVFPDGCSLLLKQQIEKASDFKYIEFIEDIRANAIGYEKMTALHIQKRQGV